jgi:PhoH-like ATPase
VDKVVYINEERMIKNYILDTNVLIHDPQSIFQFQDNHLYVPVYVLEELDRIKSEQSLRGRNSREACRIIDEFRCQGSLSCGVDVGDGKFFIYVPKERKPLPVALDPNSVDSAILQSVLEIRENTQVRTILVTMDVNLRIRAESIGIQTASYESQSIDPSRMITGTVNIEVPDGQINDMFANDGVMLESDEGLYDNACVMLKEPSGKTALGRFTRTDNTVFPVVLPKDGVMGIKPRNREQQFALNMLLDDSIKLMTLVGLAGGGKTILAIAAGLYKVTQEGAYSRLIISRPVVPMGKDIGYLPGSAEEKMDPWMQPIYDNLELLMMTGGGKRKTGMKYEELFQQNMIRVEPLTYIRGRSLPNQYIIVDESQNLSTHEIKTIITRCGEGSKVILTGDPDQIDSPYMDKATCGLSIAVEKLHDNPIVGHMTLSKGERSELANLAATLM